MKSTLEDTPTATMPKGRARKRYKAAVLFCGAGGDTAGSEEAMKEAGLDPEFTLINHWPVATNTIGKNFPDARVLTTAVDAVNPRALYKEGELKSLWASPECTHHSVARGGKPINDQSRVTAWCVVRWIEACQPDHVWVENVCEFLNWGPLLRKKVKYTHRPEFAKWHQQRCPKLSVRLARAKWKKLKGELRTRIEWVPDPKRKGEIFHAWRNAIESAGYRFDYRKITCSDFGDPTTRVRLFIQCVRKASRKKIVWPNPTHAESPTDDLFGVRQPWATAENDVIDWSLPGKSIFDRKIPHADNTLRRIIIGFLQGLETADLSAFTIGQQSDAAPRSVKQPVATVAAAGAIALAEPKLIKLRGTCTTADVNQPCPSLTTGNHVGLMEPKLVEVNHGSGGKSDDHRVKSAKKPLGTVTGTRGLGLAEYVVQFDQNSKVNKSKGSRPVNKPVPTIVSKANLALVEAQLKPYILGHPQSKNDAIRPVDEPVFAVTATSSDMALVQPKIQKLDSFIVPQFSSQGPRSVSRPMPTLTTQSRGVGLATPAIVNLKGKSNATSASKPTPAVTAHARHLALADPHIIPFHGERHEQEARRHSIKKPVPTVPCSPTLALSEAFVLPREGIHRGNKARSVKKPFFTVTTNGGGALIQPQVIKFNGTGGAKSVKLPLDTVTTKERFALVQFLITQVKKKNRPLITINDQPIGYLEILFRMFQWYELALAQGFRPGYQFTGKVEEVVKQIGNAVPRRTVRALVKAAITQNPNV